jgi:hypothetical protein
MKNNLVILSFVAVFALTAGFTFAGSNIAMHVNVPFDFYAAGQQFAAGEYSFVMTSGLNPTASTVTVRAQDGQTICILTTQAGNDVMSLTNLLRFNEYGDKHFLSSVSIQGFKASVQPQKMERELKAQMEKERNTVIIAQN